MENEALEKTGRQESNTRVMVTDYSKGIFGTSDNFLMAMQMSKALAASSIIPKEFQGNPSNCLIAIEQAQRLGMSPMMVMQNMYIVYGRPSWSSKFLIAMINSSGRYDTPLQYDETWDAEGKPYSCMAWAVKDGERIEGMTVDMNIARAEGWLDRNGSKWKTMPQLMLRYRAASFFSSLNCPDITMGIHTDDEVRDGGIVIDEALAEAGNAMIAGTAAIPVELPLPPAEPTNLKEAPGFARETEAKEAAGAYTQAAVNGNTPAAQGNPGTAKETQAQQAGTARASRGSRAQGQQARQQRTQAQGQQALDFGDVDPGF